MPNLYHYEISPRSEEGAGPINARYAIAFDTLLACGATLILAALLTAALCRSVHRLITWYNFMGSMGLSCLSYLVLAGHQTGPEPPFGFCLISATLVTSALVLVVVTAFAYAVEIYLTVVHILNDSYPKSKYTRFLLAVPYFVYWLTAIGVFTASFFYWTTAGRCSYNALRSA
ncbi:hypothetical protein HGRIS_000446 [Hohenbuehelia grisea]|uniref:Uncharacterized protein n=1 Tax=Hohenbuehelia grisea TaxID=104357 RepID=A0ABR3JSN9_9AGAR